MHRTTFPLRAVGLAFALTLGLVPVAGAGTTVDPETLIPPPPPGAQCTATGAFIICATSLEVHT
jgi:hypothetical protein